MERESTANNLKELIETDNCSEDGTLFYRVAAISPVIGTLIGGICDGWSGAGYGFLYGLAGSAVFGTLAYLSDIAEEPRR
jgi:hypothetical protein